MRVVAGKGLLHWAAVQVQNAQPFSGAAGPVAPEMEGRSSGRLRRFRILRPGGGSSFLWINLLFAGWDRGYYQPLVALQCAHQAVPPRPPAHEPEQTKR